MRANMKSAVKAHQQQHPPGVSRLLPALVNSFLLMLFWPISLPVMLLFFSQTASIAAGAAVGSVYGVGLGVVKLATLLFSVQGLQVLLHGSGECGLAVVQLR